MIRHVVMWKMKEEALGMKRPALILELKSRLEVLVGVVPQIKSFQVGVNIVESPTAHDLGLVSDFDDLAGLQGYIDHPVHQELVAYLKQIVAERRAVDYETL